MNIIDDFITVEKILSSHPNIERAVVVPNQAQPDRAGAVTAYYVLATYEQPCWADLMSGVDAATLGRVEMVEFVSLKDLPVDEQGEIDRDRLANHSENFVAEHGYQPPTGESEITIAGIFAEVLGVGQIDRRDNFFKLGGSSLLAVRATVRIKAEFGKAISVETFFDAPTVERLAAALLLPVLSEEPGQSFGSGSF